MFKRLLVIAVFCLPMSLLAAGKIYTWTDENGDVFYGDRPPLIGDVTEVAIKGKKQEPVSVESSQLHGQWYGSINGGGDAKITFSENGSISFIQTRADQSIYSYQGIWTSENTTITVITEFSQSSSGGEVKRSVEPIQLTYTVIGFTENQMELISLSDRFSLRKTK